MKLKRTYKSFINGRFVYEGVRITAGIILPSLIFGPLGFLKEGIVMSVGALCVSSADAAGPLHHRKNAMLVCNLLIFLVALITGSVCGNVVALAFCLVLFSFIFSMFAIYGARVTSIGIACLLIMVLNMDHPLKGLPLILNALYILYGGIWYMCFSLSLHRIRPYKLVQQMLGDVIESTADYLLVRADFYKRDVNYDQVYSQLMQKQASLQEKQNNVSEILFRTRAMLKETTNTGRVLVMVFLEVTDLFERLMTTYQQYEVLHQYFDNTSILTDLRNILLQLEEELREIGLAIKSGKTSSFKESTDELLKNARITYEGFRNKFMSAENVDGFLALGRIFESIQDLGERVRVLHHYTTYDRKIKRKTEKVNYNDFIVRQEISPELFFDSLSFHSNIFRHSVRVSVAVLFGYLIAVLLKLGHAYWILLTIIVILKPAYSLTKNRNKDRIIGTSLGILIGVLFLYFISNHFILLAIMIVFMTTSYIFLRTNYFLSVLLMTPYLLIFFHLIDPLDFKQVLWDRFFDTVTGSAIAFLANIFLIPAWEHTTMNTYMKLMLEANSNYYNIVCSAYVDAALNISDQFQKARKEVMIALANLSDAFTRMLSEPARQQMGADKVHRFVVLNHTLTSHIAALSYFHKRDKSYYTSKSLQPVIRQTVEILNAGVVILDHEQIETSIYSNKVALRKINLEADELLRKRKEEIGQGLYETDTKIALIRIKPVVDQFNYIFAISTDILKIVEKIETDFKNQH